jgi:hypothetical protein
MKARGPAIYQDRWQCSGSKVALSLVTRKESNCMFETHHKTDAFKLLVSPYHPDTLRDPSSGPDATQSDRLRHALTWNVFKTLEQIVPSAWLRPLVARATGLPDGYASAPQTTAVSCWSNLRPGPNALLRRGRRLNVPFDAIVDTDDTVVTFLTPSPTELLDTVLSETAAGGLLDVAEATAYLAGTRSAYVSVILPTEVEEEVWAARVQRRAERVSRLLSSSGRSLENLRGMGATTWSALHELLSEVAHSRFISRSEQRFARAAVDWMSDRLAVETSAKRLA